MSGPRRLDARRAANHRAELVRRALAVLSGDGTSMPLGPIGEALFGVAGRIAEEVSGRIDRVPQKQAANFYTAAGIGRDPARPAKLHVAFKLTEGTRERLSAPAGTRLMAGAAEPVIFETGDRIDLIPSAIVAVRGLDAAADSVAMPANSFTAGRPPWRKPILRRLASAAAIGADKLQIDPTAGLEPGMLIELGETGEARQYKVEKVDGPLVTIAPPLEAGLSEGAPAVEAAAFAPFDAATGNLQAHALYLGHSTLLDVPSKATIHVSGVDLPADAVWSLWAQAGDDPPSWRDLTRLAGNNIRLAKGAEKPAKTKIGGSESLWLRAHLPNRSSAPGKANTVMLAVGGEGCAPDAPIPCDKLRAAPAVGFEAIANTTPVVANKPFHPFGREPRLYDSFYVGSDEALSKKRAQITLCFDFGGPDLGAVAAVLLPAGPQLFGVGRSGVVYRADFTQERPRLLAFPPLPDEPADLFAAAGAIDARVDGSDIMLAIGTKGAVHLGALKADSKLTADSISWLRLPTPEADKDAALDQVVISAGPNPTVYALARSSKAVEPTKLLAWNPRTPQLAPASRLVRRLAKLQGSEGVAIIEDDPSVPDTLRIGIRRASDADFTPAQSNLAPDSLPAAPAPLAIFAPGDTRTDLSLAFVDSLGWVQLLQFRGSHLEVSSSKEQLGAALPIAFLPQSAGSSEDVSLVLATSPPRQFVKSGGGKLALVQAVRPIGASSNEQRRFMFVGGRAIVQNADSGLLYRNAIGDGLLEKVVVEARPLYLAEDTSGALANAFAALPADLNGGGYGFGPAMGGLRRLASLADGSTPPPSNALDFYRLVEVRQATKQRSRLLVLAGTDPFGDRIVVRLEQGGSVGLWALDRTAEGWASAADLPGPDGGSLACGILQTSPAPYFPPAVEPVRPAELQDRLRSGQLLAAPGGETVAAFQTFDGTDYLPLPPASIRDGRLLLFAEPEPWAKLGPDAPANPALSWEYWNGSAWWALAPAALVDRTANFQENGNVFFRVPDDLEPTEVGGKKSHWIRARLVGGDYGEARVTVTTTDKGGGKTEQSAARDPSSVRAPYVTSLHLGYCAMEPTRPEIVLAEDNLGFVDQTSANQAELDFPIFVPVAEAMNPRAVTPPPTRTIDARGCGDLCPVPASADDDPCARPGACDSCDTPCVCPGGPESGDTRQGPGFVRGLMIGFDRPLSGQTVSLYVDAAPQAPPARLVAEMLHNGRFVPLRVVGDGSAGLSESGLVTLAIPEPPDLSDRLGASAYWLRLRPESGASNWSPRLRGLYLNAVSAASLETRRMERIGSSDGTPNQQFRLAEAPVEPDSLELRVREPLEDADRSDPAVDIASYAQLDGEWVRWTSGDPEAATDAARIFAFDSGLGVIQFGDGRHGRIPPAGAELMAIVYAKVHGRSANGVAAGSDLQLASALAGVESVFALDEATGGTDVETVESGVRRAAAKVRHGNRILSLADLEDYAATLASGIAQVRAERRGAAVRLIVVGTREGSGWLREMQSQIGKVSGYALARTGGLEVVAPRILLLGLELDLEPARADLFADAADRASAAIQALFDPATGNHDGLGWPLGRLPDGSDIAAALSAIGSLAQPTRIRLFRVDPESGSRSDLPRSIPSDVLVRIDAAAISIERSAEAAA